MTCAIMGFCRWQKKRSQSHRRAQRHEWGSRKHRKHQSDARRFDARSFNIHRPQFIPIGHMLGGAV